MRRADDDALKRLGFDPTIGGATAGKHQRMHSVRFDDRQLKISAEGRR